MLGVLDGEVVQAELALHAAQQRLSGSSRPIQTTWPCLLRHSGFLDGDVGDAPAIGIDAGGDDAFGTGGHRGSNGCGCNVHGFRPSMIVVEFCLEATFFWEG